MARPQAGQLGQDGDRAPAQDGPQEVGEQVGVERHEKVVQVRAHAPGAGRRGRDRDQPDQGRHLEVAVRRRQRRLHRHRDASHARSGRAQVASKAQQRGQRVGRSRSR